MTQNIVYVFELIRTLPHARRHKHLKMKMEKKQIFQAKIISPCEKLTGSQFNCCRCQITALEF